MRSESESDALSSHQKLFANSGNIGAVSLTVRFNGGFGGRVAKKYLQTWSNVLRMHDIRHVILFGSNLRNQTHEIRRIFPDLRISVCEPEDESDFLFERGLFFYAAPHLCPSLYDNDHRGYLFAHDDAVLDFHQIMCGMLSLKMPWVCQNPDFDLTADMRNETDVKSHRWGWNRSPYGAPAVQSALSDPSFVEKYGLSLNTCNAGRGLRLFKGQADVFYIPKRLIGDFTEAAAQFYEHRIFLEIAVHTIVHCIFEQVSNLTLWTVWGAERGRVPKSTEIGKFMVYHPLKLTNPAISTFMHDFIQNQTAKHCTT